MKKYVMIKTSTVWYDRKGGGDDGGDVISVEFTDNYNHLDFDKEYTDDLYEVNEENDEYHAEDGYNCPVKYLTFKEINKKHYDWFKAVTKEHDEMLKKIQNG